MKFTYLDVSPDTLDDGRPLAFGDEVELNQKAQDANKRLMDEGKLVEVKTTKTSNGGKS